MFSNQSLAAEPKGYGNEDNDHLHGKQVPNLETAKDRSTLEHPQSYPED